MRAGVDNSNRILGWLLHYLGFVLAANLVWESLHMPRYTLWQADAPRELVKGVLVYAMVDLVIATLVIPGISSRLAPRFKLDTRMW